jgi:tetratricopeptide (TPR) repeat protein
MMGDHGFGHYDTLAPAMGSGWFKESFPVLRLVPGPMGFQGDFGPGAGDGHYPGYLPWHEMPVARTPQSGPAPAVSTEAEKKDEPELLPAGYNRLVSRGGAQAAEGSKRETETASKIRPAGYKPVNLRGLTDKDAERLFWRGYSLFWRGEHQEALSLFEAAAELYRDDARFWYFRSLAEDGLGQKKESEDSLKKAVDLHRQGKPSAALIGQALERVQGEARLRMRKALDAPAAAR